MILKSFLVEKNIKLLDQYFANLVYGENIGMKDDIKNQIKSYLKDYEQINLNQDEIIKNEKILNEHIYNTSLFSKKKIIFINEISDKFKDIICTVIENPKIDLKLFLFAQNLEKKSVLRKMFEKEKSLGVVACYQDNERSLDDYVRKNLQGYNGLSQQIINFLIKNSGLDRKTLLHEIEKIKLLFLDKKIQIDKLPELLNNNNNLEFNHIRDYCLGAERENLNKSLGSMIFQNENSFFYLSVLSNRIEKLINVYNEFEKEKNLEIAIDKVKPPIFWKEKPSFHKQFKRWNSEKLQEAKKILFKTELQIKKNVNSNNSLLIKSLIINLYQKAASTS
jgi:DNA polymerase-3 subunit delta